MRQLILSNRWLRFFVPSSLGVAVFLIPLKTEEGWSLGLGIMLDATLALVGQVMPYVVMAILLTSWIGILVCRFKGINQNPYFPWHAGSFSARLLATILGFLVISQIGPDWLIGEDTGRLAFGLLEKLVPFFFWAGLLLPLLLNYGLMEFVGSFFQPVMYRLALVPGRAAVDCTASWLGSGSMGVVLTDLQYREGYYTGREAATIATGFSVVSVPIAIMLITIIGLGPWFLPIYVATIITGMIVTAITARIPPLSRLPNTYCEGPFSAGERGRNSVDSRSALERAMARASEKKQQPFWKTGGLIVADIWFGLLPLVLVLGATTLILAEHTAVFNILSRPFAWGLSWMGVAEATAASPALLVGFADVFLPFIVGQRIEDVGVRIFLAIVGLVQIIFMTEVGVLLLKSKIPLNFIHLVWLFLLRTFLALPLAWGFSLLLLRLLSEVGN
jgi:nucleoside recognition membrane protein YjiH